MNINILLLQIASTVEGSPSITYMSSSPLLLLLLLPLLLLLSILPDVVILPRSKWTARRRYSDGQRRN